MSHRPDAGTQRPSTRLGVPLQHPREAGLVSLGLGLYYLATMSRDMSLYDSPELALVAVQAGVGHPIGQPLHSLLGHLLVVAGGALGVAPLLILNGLSAVAGALSLLPVVSLLDTLTPAPQAAVGPLPEGAGALVAASQRWWRPLTVGVLATHACLWEPATRIEVYPLATLLALVALAWAAHGLACAGSQRTRAFALAGLLAALATGANVVSVAFMGCGFAPLLAQAIARKEPVARALLAGLAASALGLLVWVYVPIAAQDPSVIAWGRPSTSEALRAYLSGADYQGKSVRIFSLEFVQHLQQFLEWALRAGLLPLPALGLLGLGLRARALLWPAAFVLLLNVGWYARYDPYAPGVLDYLGYLAAPLLLMSGGCALLLEWAYARSRGLSLALSLALLAVAVTATPSPWERTRAQDDVTRQLAEAALDALPPDAILLTEADHSVGALLYLQEVEGRREDVTLLPLGLASSSWMWEHIAFRHPALQPFELRGPGGRNARVMRFLAANATRRTFATESSIGPRLGLSTCARGVVIQLERCADVTAPEDTLLPLLLNHRRRLRDGSPATASLIAWHAEDHARALAFEGRARDAFLNLVLSLNLDAQLGSSLSARIPTRVPAFHLPDIPERPDQLGSDRRNLLLAAAIASMARQPEVAATLRNAAANALR